MKKSPVTGTGYRKIADDSCVAVFDKDFCPKVQMANFTEELDKLMAQGQILKNGDASYVSRVRWNDRDVVVKRYNNTGFFHSLRHTIKGSRARRSWLYGHRLATLDIATPRPLAYIEQRKYKLLRKSYLITEYIEGQRFYDFLRDDSIAGEQHLSAIRKVMQMLENLWNNRITHGDLKHTNILVAKDVPVLTDLDGMMVHRWKLLYKKKRTKDIERFLKKTDIPPAIYQYCRSLISDKTGFSEKLSTDFNKIQVDGWTIFIRSDFPRDKIREIIQAISPSGEFCDRFTQIPSSDYARVFKCNIFSNGKDRSLFLKQYLCRSSADFIKHIFRPGRAKRAFFASLMLQNNGFDAPEVIGLFERRCGFLCTDGLLLTRQVENARPMPQYFTDICRNFDKFALAKKRSLIKTFAQTIGQMHAKGISHGDLRLNNVLVVPSGQDERFFFIDNERTKKHCCLPALLRLKNLVQINMFRDGISNTDRMRFFRTYLNMNQRLQSHYSILAGKIAKKTNRRLRQKNTVQTKLRASESNARRKDFGEMGISTLSDKPEGYFQGVRQEMLKYVPAGAKRTLEFGCGCGGFSASIKGKFGAETWAVEIDKAAAEQAAKKIDNVLNVNAADSLYMMPDNYFDCILFLDVLEHLIDPYSLLVSTKSKLTDKGLIVASIPNVRYYRNYVDFAVRGNWDYQNAGIMDKTHLRFFTYKSIIKMFEGLGFEILAIEGIRSTKNKMLRLLNVLLLGTLEDLQYQQFAVVAKPKNK
jgi:tRNA A-37 threonylcarbamoyl transferase component Bud32/2-polyprenyl-3-methyl-5-hydroxy-6-metoxy-1,4-benzoquinol methylase